MYVMLVPRIGNHLAVYAAKPDGECFQRVLYFAAIDRFYSFVVVRILSLTSFA